MQRAGMQVWAINQAEGTSLQWRSWGLRGARVQKELIWAAWQAHSCPRRACSKLLFLLLGTKPNQNLPAAWKPPLQSLVSTSK